MNFKACTSALLFGASALCLVPAAASAKEIIFLAEDVPAGLDYNGPSATVVTSQTGVVNLLEPLIDYADGPVNEEGIVLPDFDTFEGHLAESWSFDEESLTWTFKLRQGLMSCEGNELTADDVLYTFARAKSVSGANPIGQFLTSVASIEGFGSEIFSDEALRVLGDEVSKVDDYTFTIRQETPNELFLPVLTIFALHILDKTAMEANATEDDLWSANYMNNVNAPGWGAYCLESWAKNEQIVFTANENFWDGKPDIDRVIMMRVPQSSNRMMVLQSGQAQLAQALTPREYDSLRSVPGVDVGGIIGNQTLFVGMNFDVPPFDNPLVRKAFAHAVNYEQIIQTGYYGQAEKWDSLIPSTFPGYQATEVQYDYDMERAKELLAEAGYPNGEGLEQFADAFNLHYIAEKESILGPIATSLQGSFRELGIPIRLDPIPQTQFGERQSVLRDMPMALYDHEQAIGIDAGYAVQLYFVTPEEGGFQNSVNFDSPRVDELWRLARPESDVEARNEMLHEIQDILMENVTWIPVVEYKSQWAMSDKLSGLRWYPDVSVRFKDLVLED